METVHIKTNKAWAKAVQELLDIALKSAWIQALQWATHILNILDVDEEFFKKIDEENTAQKKQMQEELEKKDQWASKK